MVSFSLTTFFPFYTGAGGVEAFFVSVLLEATAFADTDGIPGMAGMLFYF